MLGSGRRLILEEDEVWVRKVVLLGRLEPGWWRWDGTPCQCLIRVWRREVERGQGCWVAGTEAAGSKAWVQRSYGRKL
jgi:hypothetical protein